eukprot:6174640-Pleurochrysis_carterae.AAC.1
MHACVERRQQERVLRLNSSALWRPCMVLPSHSAPGGLAGKMVSLSTALCTHVSVGPHRVRCVLARPCWRVRAASMPASVPDSDCIWSYSASFH